MVCGACTREPPPFDAAIAAVDYAAPWDRLVTAFKFHDAIDLARPFARAIALAERAREEYEGSPSTPATRRELAAIERWLEARVAGGEAEPAQPAI